MIEIRKAIVPAFAAALLFGTAPAMAGEGCGFRKDRDVVEIRVAPDAAPSEPTAQERSPVCEQGDNDCLAGNAGEGIVTPVADANPEA